jgi:type II secretory pathway pseudopilin PulG
VSRRQIFRRIRARLHGERGFTILETVVAMTVVFASLTALAYTATIGLRYGGYGRDRIQATGIANRIMEDIRGLAYTKVTGGISTAELASDSRIVNCSGTYRFQSCSGEKIVSSTFSVGYDADWLYPHTGSFTEGNLDVTYATYVTNDAPTTNPYRVTVILAWSNGAIQGAPNNSVRLQSLFWSPSGCVNPNTHPFAAPCQPFFYGQVEASQPRLDVTGSLHDFSVDLDSFTLTRPGLSGSAQEEQTKQLNVVTTLSGVQVVDSTGTETVGSDQATSDADDEVETAAAAVAGGSSTSATSLSLTHVNADCCLQIGLIASVPAGEMEGRGASVAAKGTDASACPTTGTRETDQLACAGGHVRAAGTTTVSIPVTHVTPTVGAANLLRVVASGVDTIATIDRDASGGTSEDGLIDISTSRTLGTVQLGGFPSSGMTAPANMSATQTNDNNYCVRLTGYSDSARAIAGERTSTNPSATISAGTFFYYTGSGGSGYSSKSVTDATLDTLTVTCSKTQLVGLSTVTWRVTVASGGVEHATTTTSQTADPSDAQTRYDAEAITDPIEITIRYEYIVDGVHQVDLSATFDPGDLFAHGIYQAPPAAQS